MYGGGVGIASGLAMTASVATAAAVGRSLPSGGVGIVYGGSRSGCMGALADAALAAGGGVVGVVPRQLNSVEQRHLGLTALGLTEDLAARTLRMFEFSDAVRVLPGGTGTLDEFLEALTMKRLAQLSHPLAVLDIDAFFEPVIALLQHFVATGFAETDQLELLARVARVEDLGAWRASMKGRPRPAATQAIRLALVRCKKRATPSN